MSIRNDDLELANAMFGRPNATNQNGSDLGDISTGVAVVDSAEGKVQVNPTGSTLGDTQLLTLPTWPAVKTGDVVNIKVVNGSPVVIGVVGSGDNVSVSFNQLSDRIASEVTARKQTDDKVSTLSTSVTQKADQVSIDTINNQIATDGETIAKVNEHFVFGTSGLEISSSTSSTDMTMGLSNSALEFKANGSTVLELDGTSSTAKASKFQVGKYCWTSTGNGSNMSLLYVGDA